MENNTQIIAQTKKRCVGAKCFLSVIAGMGVLFATPSFSNGLYESSPWQFQTTADRVNKSAVLDVIERKKGGYYDGFGTNYTTEYTTNIGSQVNCNNNANATGNIADNGQAGASTENNGDPVISADSDGNSDADTAQYDGAGSGETNNSGSQDNSGPVDSAVDSSDINNSSGDVENGETNQAINNAQDNSGDQTASVDSSTACGFDGATVSGAVSLPSSGPLN
jgi:hypothetical protein